MNFYVPNSSSSHTSYHNTESGAIVVVFRDINIRVIVNFTKLLQDMTTYTISYQARLKTSNYDLEKLTDANSLATSASRARGQIALCR